MSPDISMCRNSDCPSHRLCYRFMAIPSDYQTTARFEPEEGQIRCDHFIEITQDDRTTELPKTNSKRRAWHY
jgi:hypothetical protein